MPASFLQHSSKFERSVHSTEQRLFSLCCLRVFPSRFSRLPFLSPLLVLSLLLLLLLLLPFSFPFFVVFGLISPLFSLCLPPLLFSCSRCLSSCVSFSVSVFLSVSHTPSVPPSLLSLPLPLAPSLCIFVLSDREETAKGQGKPSSSDPIESSEFQPPTLGKPEPLFKRCGAALCGALRCSTVRYGTVRHGAVRCGAVQHCAVRYGAVRCELQLDLAWRTSLYTRIIMCYRKRMRVNILVLRSSLASPTEMKCVGWCRLYEERMQSVCMWCSLVKASILAY